MEVEAAGAYSGASLNKVTAHYWTTKETNTLTPHT